MERERLLVTSSPVGGDRTLVAPGGKDEEEDRMKTTVEVCAFVADHLWTLELLVAKVEGRSSKLAVHACIRQFKELQSLIVATVKEMAEHRDEWEDFG